NTHSFYFDRNISKDMLTALAVTAIALKTGAVPAALTAVGILAPAIFVVPIVIGGAMLFPVVVMVGGSFLIFGFTALIGLTGAGLSIGGALLPIIIPLWV